MPAHRPRCRTCGSSFDTNTKIEGPGIANNVWHDDDGACRTNSRNEVFNQALFPGSYVVTVNRYGSDTGFALMQMTITCPDEGESLTPGQYCLDSGEAVDSVPDTRGLGLSFLNLLSYRRFQGWSFSIAMSSIPLSGTDTVPCTVGLCQICLNATACRPNCRSPFPSRTLPRPFPPELLRSIRDNA